MIWLWVAFGGAVGAWLRYAIGAKLGQRCSQAQAVPWPTWIINVTGSFLLGFIIGCSPTLPEFLVSLLGIGFCGAFTTFSTFGVEALKLWQKRNYLYFMMYVLITAIATTAMAAIGLAAGKLII